jgi:small subunit ribosomal protein S4
MKISTTVQCRLCRRAGKKLFLKGERCDTSKCAIVKRNYVPGLHGPKFAASNGRRMTDYGKQLNEKQIAKRTYGLRERQFSAYYEKAVNQKGDSGQNFYKLLEFRLDNVIARLGWGRSMKHSRQLVNHGHFLVNGKKMDIPSFQVKVNDVISIKESSLEKSRSFTDLAERMKNKELPGWLFYDEKSKTAKVVEVPNVKTEAQEFDIKKIIEFYSR